MIAYRIFSYDIMTIINDYLNGCIEQNKMKFNIKNIRFTNKCNFIKFYHGFNYGTLYECIFDFPFIKTIDRKYMSILEQDEINWDKNYEKHNPRTSYGSFCNIC